MPDVAEAGHEDEDGAAVAAELAVDVAHQLEDQVVVDHRLVQVLEHRVHGRRVLGVPPLVVVGVQGRGALPLP
jgi:hypothetical protein